MSFFEPIGASVNPFRYIRWFLPHESIILEVDTSTEIIIIMWLHNNVSGYYDWSIIHYQEQETWMEIRVRKKNAHIFSALILAFSI